MIIALTIISIALVFSVIGNIILFRHLDQLANLIIEEHQIKQALAFSSGEIDIPADEIAQEFLDAIVLYRIEKSSCDNDVSQIVDTSNYQKNRLIKLTDFVQPQFFEELKEDMNMDKITENVRNRIINKLYDDEDDVDEDFLNGILDQTIQEVLRDSGYSIEEGTMTRPLLPHCTVYQLKNGRWVWRQEEHSN